METQNGPDVVLLRVNDLLVISLAEERKRHPVGAERRLDNIGDISLVCLGVEVVKRLSAGFLMSAEVVISSVGNAPKLAPPEREKVLDIGGSL